MTVAIGKKEESWEDSSADKNNDYNIENVSVHSLPEKFRKQKIHSGDAKKTGLFILIVGTLVLVSLLVYAYFYFINTDTKYTEENSVEVGKVVEETNKDKVENVDETESKQAQEKLAKEEEAIDAEQNIAELAAVEKEIASSTFKQATSTKTTTSKEIANIVVKEEEPKLVYSDIDEDGLSDTEEELLGTSVDKADSDEDGYSDLNELENHYNPAGVGNLSENIFMTRYNNILFGYSFLYPTNLKIDEVGGAESLIVRLKNNDFVQVISQNINYINIEDWYKEEFGVEQVDEASIILNDNWEGILNKNGLTTYIKINQSNVLITINYSSKEVVQNYKNIFNSLEGSLQKIQ